MTDFHDDDSGFWDQRSEPTIRIERVKRRAPERTRSHHVVERDPSRPTPRVERARHDVVDDAQYSWATQEEADEYAAMWIEPTRSRRGGIFGSIDPRLLSLGAIAVTVALAVPVVGSMGGDDSNASRQTLSAESTTTEVVTTTVPAPTTTILVVSSAPPVAVDATDDESSSGELQLSGDDRPAAADDDSAAESDGGSSGASGGAASPDAAATPATVLAAPAQRSPLQCANPYEVQAGDFWVSIANAVDTPLADLLEYNEATKETPLYPGSTVCLPIGTSIAPPTTAAPATAAAPEAPTEPATTEPATTEPASTATPTTQSPATEAPTTAAPTTAAPTTTSPPRVTTPIASGGAVEQMIRDVWPDDLEDQALRIAWRESNYRPDVTSRTGCCVGVFQLHWEAHRSWLAGLGISSRDQLFDARTNIEAAYALYQRSGGWGPWSLG